MIFDLRGRRKRLVQVIYASLALLMGGGLVLFGIGSDASGGLFDALGVGDGRSGGRGAQLEQLENRAASLEQRLQADPDDTKAMVELARTRYLAANAAAERVQSDTPDQQPGGAEQLEYTPESRNQLEKATATWEQYLDEVEGRANSNVAVLMAQAYAILNDADGAADAQAVVARARPAPATLFELARYQYFAGETAKAKRSAERALAEAPRADRDALEEQLEAVRSQARAYRAAVEQEQESAPNPFTGAQPGGQGGLGGQGGGLGGSAGP